MKKQKLPWMRMSNSQLLNQKLKEKAIQLLAKRSYSSYALEEKLRLFYPKLALKESLEFDSESVLQSIQQIIDYCQVKHWLDDIDFLTRYIKDQYRKGYGPNRIIMNLRQQGFEKEDIEVQFEALELNFFESLQNCVQKKWGETSSKLEIKDKQKRYLYLTARGFLSDSVQTYLEQE